MQNVLEHYTHTKTVFSDRIEVVLLGGMAENDVKKMVADGWVVSNDKKCFIKVLPKKVITRSDISKE